MTQYCAAIKENKGDLDVLMGGRFLRHIKRRKHSIEENDPFCINYNVDAYVFKCIFFFWKEPQETMPCYLWGEKMGYERNEILPSRFVPLESSGRPLKFLLWIYIINNFFKIWH